MQAPGPGGSVLQGQGVGEKVQVPGGVDDKSQWKIVIGRYCLKADTF